MKPVSKTIRMPVLFGKPAYQSESEILSEKFGTQVPWDDSNPKFVKPCQYQVGQKIKSVGKNYAVVKILGLTKSNGVAEWVLEIEET